MMTRNKFLSLALGATLAGAMGCAPNVGTIDRTQPNALDKRQFEGIWYHRATITESDPEAGHTEGITSTPDKIRWDITESLLIGYRSYEFVPYAEGLTDEGRDFFGAPVAAFRILSHFDIQRDYNPTTGVENNVIVENTTDRPWFERQYIRVDWSQNMVGRETAFWTGWVNYPDGYFSGSALSKYYVQGHEATAVDRPIFTEDYFDVTNVYHLEPDEYYCAYMLLYNSVPRCGAANVKVRLSFRKVNPTDDYESLYYPDTVELKDDAGNTIVLNGDGRACGSSIDPGDCYTRTFGYDERFGNFRTMRVAFDEERFLTNTGRIYLAGRHDLWQDSFNDADGALLPYTERKPKPIVYYGNVGFPEELIPAAQKMAVAWDKPFAQTVAMLMDMCVDANNQPTSCKDGSGQPRFDVQADTVGMKASHLGGADMFQFRRNDCNPENIVAYAQANDLMDVVNEIAGSADGVAPGNVEQVCSAVQFRELQNGATLDPKVAQRDGAKLAFQWQRKGDIRYNFQNYIEPVQWYGPWGVAQFTQDPETGEFLSNTANYFGDAGDNITQSEVDVLQWLNGDLTEEQLFRGDIARDTVISRRGVKNNGIRDVVKNMLMNHEEDLIGQQGDKLFPPARPGDEDERRQAIFGGTDIEREFLVTDEILRGFAGPSLYQPISGAAQLPGVPGFEGLDLVPGEVSDDAFAAAAPANWGLSPETNTFESMVRELGSRGFEMADFFSVDTSGLAEEVKGWERERIYDFLRAELYASVNGHEVGHTLGLRHNFSASMDPLNYRPEFWYHVDEQGQVQQFWNNPSSADNKHRGTEYKYASIMDYGFDIPMEGLHGIGSYDEAAIRFMYGQLVDVWNPTKVSLPDPRKYGSWARRCGHDDEYMGLPSLFRWLDPISIPSVLSGTAKEQAPCAGDYDNNTSCDSEMDTLVRELVNRMEATAENQNLTSECAIWYNISDLNWMINEVQTRAPKPENVYGARATIPASVLMNQQLQVLTNPPEYDDASTRENEATDGQDSDNDGQADDKGYDWSKYLYKVNYDYCSDLYAGYSNPFCQRWDAGWDFTESVDYHINRYDRDYVFDHFRRDQYVASPTGWGSGRGYIQRLLSRRFYAMSNVFRYYLYTRRTAFDAPLFKDWAEAAYRGLNFLERVLQTPEPGTYCLNAGTNTYEMWDGTSTCNEQFDIGLGYGQGKYLNTSWTNEYYYKPNRIGAFYDKWAAMYQITTSSGFFFRDTSDWFDRRAFSLGYMRVYEDPMIQRFAALITGDFSGYEARVLTDPDSNEKYVRYMPFFDEQDAEGGSVRQALETEPKIAPSWSWTLQYLSLYYSLSNWGSINDYALEFYRLTKVAIKGTPEDVVYGTDMPIAEFTDPETLITYRAPCIAPRQPSGLVQEFPAYYGDRAHMRRGQFHDWGMGCTLLEDAQDFFTNTWTPLEAACRASNDPIGDECTDFERARRLMNEKTGYISIIRKFNRAMEGW